MALISAVLAQSHLSSSLAFITEWGFARAQGGGLPVCGRRPVNLRTKGLVIWLAYGVSFEPSEYKVVQGARPGFPIGCRVDLPQACQGEDNVVWIKSGADDARLPGGGEHFAQRRHDRRIRFLEQRRAGGGGGPDRLGKTVFGHCVLSEAGHPFA
jgi:hypothetical protein